VFRVHGGPEQFMRGSVIGNIRQDGKTYGLGSGKP